MTGGTLKTAMLIKGLFQLSRLRQMSDFQNSVPRYEKKVKTEENDIKTNKQTKPKHQREL